MLFFRETGLECQRYIGGGDATRTPTRWWEKMCREERLEVPDKAGTRSGTEALDIFKEGWYGKSALKGRVMRPTVGSNITNILDPNCHKTMTNKGHYICWSIGAVWEAAASWPHSPFTGNGACWSQDLHVDGATGKPLVASFKPLLFLLAFLLALCKQTWILQTSKLPKLCFYAYWWSIA